MTAKELITILEQHPPDKLVALADPNFGGVYRELESSDVEATKDAILINFPCVSDVD